MFNEKVYRQFHFAENFGKNILAFDELSSTTEYLLKNSVPPYTVVTADFQTAGRGRSGRVWISEKSSNLYFSINLPPLSIEKLLPLNIAVGFAVCDCLKKYADVRLKWPNDIMIDSKKMGGILFETAISGSSIEKIVLGIGLNINMNRFPAEIKDIASSLSFATGETYSKEQILAELMNHFEVFYESFKLGKVNIVSEWEKYSASLDKKIAVHKNGVKTVFLERGITPSGFLIAEDAKGAYCEIVTGDIGYDFSC